MGEMVLMLLLLIGAASGLSRSDFPAGFVFGTASSSYQYEGAALEGGRRASIWDEFARLPGKIADSSTGDIAVDQYHKFKEDVALMLELGVDAYRFSISWSRLLPDGSSGQVNREAADYYNSLIDELVDNGVSPYVTILHWDTPLALEEAYGSWLSRDIVQDFAVYAETCFKLFGNRVKYWITLNEPHMQSSLGYNLGTLAPGRCSRDVSPSCTGPGDSSREPYLVTHHFLLAHAAAVGIYRSKFQAQHGSIGLTIDASWFEPLSDSPSDMQAAQLARDFEIGWYLDPLFEGHYPHSMVSLVGNARLPSFSEQEAAAIKGSLDFVGINHYTTHYATRAADKNASNSSSQSMSVLGYYRDHGLSIVSCRGAVPIGKQVNGINNVPWGFEKLLDYVRQRYGNPVVIVTENGISDADGQGDDQARIDYMSGYLSYLLRAIGSGSDVRGYLVWSLCDNWEWSNGFNWRFGLYRVDRQDPLLQRQAKKSARWFKRFLSPVAAASM